MASAQEVWEVSRAILADQDGYVAVLKVYMDESGTHDGSPVISVGAYLGRPSVWRDWTKRWNRQKKPIKVFHAVDCANLEGEFKGWSVDEKNEYVKNLLPVIHNTDIAAFVVAVRLDDYRGVVPDFPELKELMEPYPHTACFQWVMQTVLDLMDRNGDPQSVAFFHEVNDYQGAAHDCFKWLKAQYTHRKMRLAFGGKDDYVPLQAADALAYEGNRRFRDLKASDRKAWAALNPQGKLRTSKYFDKDSLRKWAIKRQQERLSVALGRD